MKTNPLFTLTLVLIVLTTILSCTKTEEIDKLPPISMEGKNTFGCLVNGKAWIPETEIEWWAVDRLSAKYSGESFSLTANLKINDSNIYQRISLEADFNDLGIYQIPSPPFSREIYFDWNNEPMSTTACTRYKSIPEDTEIEILYINTSQRIIAGKFSY